MIDLDSGENGRISYNVTGNASEFLSIDDRGVIRTSTENIPNYNERYLLNITAVDNGKPPKDNSTTMKVVIDLDNSNDQSIKFNQQEINMTIVEGIQIGATLDSVEKYVNASGFNVLYEMIDDRERFIINSTTGMVSTSKCIDREEQNSYDLVVKVKGTNDKSEHSDLAVVRLRFVTKYSIDLSF